MKAKWFAGSTALILLIAACMSIRPASAANRWGANYFPNTELTTQDGKKVHFYDDLIKGKIVAIMVIFTQCKDNCPLETARMREVQKALGDRVGKDIFFYSISIDPEHDTPEVLRDYAEMYNAGPGWTFLTGKKEDIDALTKKIGLYTPPELQTSDPHTPSLMIGNEKTGQWMRESAGDNPKFLVAQLETLDGYKSSAPSAVTTYAKVAPMKLNMGRYLFSTQCAACHSIGHGDKIGPDLMGVTNVRDPKWLREFIAAPDEKINGQDPIGTALFQHYKVRMPNLRLIPEDVNSIINFLKTQNGTAENAAPQTSGPQASVTTPEKTPSANK
jgi:protein SCO1